MQYKTYRHPDAKDDSRWVAIAIDHESEGEVYTACFGGYFAKERAEEYAAWKNGGGGQTFASTCGTHLASPL